MSKKEDVKVDLTLLKKLVSALESQLDAANAIAAAKNNENVADYVVEMSKATGISASIAKEASLLVGDIRQAIKLNTSPSAGADDLEAILGPLLKGGSGLPGSN